MQKKLYTIKQASRILDGYIQDSAIRLRKKLKSAWTKQRSFRVQTRVVQNESLLH